MHSNAVSKAWVCGNIYLLYGSKNISTFFSFWCLSLLPFLPTILSSLPPSLSPSSFSLSSSLRPRPTLTAVTSPTTLHCTLQLPREGVPSSLYSLLQVRNLSYWTPLHKDSLVCRPSPPSGRGSGVLCDFFCHMRRGCSPAWELMGCRTHDSMRMKGVEAIILAPNWR